MEGIAGRKSGYNLRTSRVLSPPEYVTEFIRDEDSLSILRKAQRSRPFWEIPGVSIGINVGWLGKSRHESGPLTEEFRSIQFPHFKLLVPSDRDEVIKFCVNC